MSEMVAKSIKFFIMTFFFTVMCANIANAREIDSQTFTKIKTTLNLNIPDTTLKNALNNEVDTGILVGDYIISIINQAEFGFQLRSGSYYQKYTD
ncbi:MAG: hypothetical protein HGA42_15845, partial [Nostocales cyanobacterium W4_Combined_metabat2_030]|nr:hypothetical protein [Nostocales cyanobacterium W4_Combined_metabat2_030]